MHWGTGMFTSVCAQGQCTQKEDNELQHPGVPAMGAPAWRTGGDRTHTADRLCPSYLVLKADLGCDSGRNRKALTGLSTERQREVCFRRATLRTGARNQGPERRGRDSS